MSKKSCTAREMQLIDKKAQEIFGIPSLILMENAGKTASEIALEVLPSSRKRNVVCVCGKGNNGGDGFVCCRHLINKGINVDIFLIGNPRELKGDAKINFEILKNMGKKVVSLKESNNLRHIVHKLKKANLIIDAIFGIGLTGPVREPYAGIISLINRYKKRVLSLDIPSGLDATSGRVLGCCIKANKTVTFALAKRGLIRNEGPEFCGEVVVADISIPKKLLTELFNG